MNSTIEKTLRAVIFVGLFSILFIPFLVDKSMFFPFITGKGFMFRVIVEIIFAGWLILAVSKEKYRPKKSLILLAVGAFLLSLAISAIFSENPYKSFWSNFERMEGLITHIHLFLYFVVAGAIINTEKLWTRFFHISFAANIFACLYSLVQLGGQLEINQGGVRVDATLGNATYLAIYLALNIFLLLLFLFKEKDTASSRSIATSYTLSSGLFLLYVLWSYGYRLCMEFATTQCEWTFLSPIRFDLGSIAQRLALLSIFVFFLGIYLLFKPRKFLPYVQIFGYTILILLNGYILYETQTRGAILGLLGGLLLTSLLILWKEKGDSLARKSALGVCIAVVVLVGGFVAIKDSAFVKDNPTLVRFSKISVEQAQNQARYYVWPMAIKGFLERPIFGWGQESFNYVFNKYYNPQLYKHEQWFDRTHNTVLDWLVAGGLVGLLLYLSIFVFALRSLWKTSAMAERDKSILTGLFAAYFFHNLFVFDNLVSYVMFFSVLAFIHSITAGEKRVFESRALSQTASQFVAPIVIVALVCTLYLANTRPIFASKTLIEAITPRTDGDVSKNLEAFKRALNYKTFADSEIREYLAQTTTRLVSISGVPSDTKASFANLAQEELGRQLEKTPDDTRYIIFAGTLANAIGNYEEALSYLEHAKETSPGKQIIYFEMGTAYLRMGQFDNALEAFKTAYELAPDFGEAHIIYAIGALYARQDTLAEELLSSLSEQVYYFDERIFRAYADRGDYQALLSIIAERIELEPQNTSYRLTRAAVYLNLGNRTQAIKELEYVIALDPNFKEQGEYYISEIRAGRNP